MNSTVLKLFEKHQKIISGYCHHQGAFLLFIFKKRNVINILYSKIKLKYYVPFKNILIALLRFIYWDTILEKPSKSSNKFWRFFLVTYAFALVLKETFYNLRIPINKHYLIHCKNCECKFHNKCYYYRELVDIDSSLLPAWF